VTSQVGATLPRARCFQPEEIDGRSASHLDQQSDLGIRVFHAESEGTMNHEVTARIMMNPDVMGGRPCIRGLRVTVGVIVGLLASGRSREEVLKAYPYLEDADIQAALAYAAWRSEEMDFPLKAS
jgi:uncharacterized protein (DUF433 family)